MDFFAAPKGAEGVGFFGFTDCGVDAESEFDDVSFDVFAGVNCGEDLADDFVFEDDAAVFFDDLVGYFVNGVKFCSLDSTAKFAEGDFFDLADAFAGNGEFLTDTFEGAARFVVEAEALDDDIFFFVCQDKKHFLDDLGKVNCCRTLFG